MDAKSFNAELQSGYGISLPAKHELFDEFLRVYASPGFSQRMGDAYIVATADVIREIHRQGCPRWITPFMYVQQPNHCDYYGFDTTRKLGDECPVAVFAVHTIVHEWQHFGAFLDWVKRL